jgi:hypothetical protein
MMIDRTIEKNGGPGRVFTGKVREAVIFPDQFFLPTIKRLQQKPIVIRTRHPLQDSVIVSGDQGEVLCNQSIYILFPAREYHGFVFPRNTIDHCVRFLRKEGATDRLLLRTRSFDSKSLI